MQTMSAAGASERRRRPRRSREEVSEALIVAATALFAERPSGRVTVRDIAARADVNPTLVHRYFGSKRNLMRAAVARAEARVAARVDEMPDVVSGAPAVFHAALQEREVTATIARAIFFGLFAFAVGYALFGRYILRGTGLDERSEDRVEAALVEVLQDVGRMALEAES